MDQLNWRSASTFAVVTCALFVTGCARPQAVRDVASASQPLVISLRQSGADLQQRMNSQRQTFEARAARIAAFTASARADADIVERDWRLLQNKRSLDQLTVLRERDAQIIANPLAALSGQSAASSSRAETLDLSALQRAAAALDTLRGSRRMSRDDFRVFLQAVNDETAKLAEEEGPENPPPSETPQSQ